MAATTGKARCTICSKDRSAVRCEGCLQIFCYNHLTDHRQELNKQLDEIEVNRDIFRQTLTEQTTDPKQNSLIKQIDKWEEDSIRKIRQTAEESRQLLLQYTTEHITQIEIDLNKLTEGLRHIRQENDFNEIDLNQFKEKLIKLAETLEQPSNVSIQEDFASPVNKISVVVSSSKDLSEKLQQQQLDKSREELYAQNELLQNEIEILRKALNEIDIDQQGYLALKTSFIEIEKRCVKYQKTEIQAKRQLAGYQSFINDLQREIQDLTERLSAGAEDYKTLYHKYIALEQTMKLNHHDKNRNAATTTLSSEIKLNEEELVTLLRNTYEIQPDRENKTTSGRSSFADVDNDLRECPMCFWTFPEHLTFNNRKEHIELHFA